MNPAHQLHCTCGSRIFKSRMKEGPVVKAGEISVCKAETCTQRLTPVSLSWKWVSAGTQLALPSTDHTCEHDADTLLSSLDQRSFKMD